MLVKKFTWSFCSHKIKIKCFSYFLEPKFGTNGWKHKKYAMSHLNLCKFDINGLPLQVQLQAIQNAHGYLI